MRFKSMKRCITALLTITLLFSAIPFGSVMAATTVSEWSGVIAEPENNFRVGFLSDTHADWTRMGKVFDAYAKVGGLDAVALVGDIAYNSTTNQNPSVPDNMYDGLLELMSTYKYDIPAATGAVDDGATPMVISIGNHEFPLNDTDTDVAAASKAKFVDANMDEIFFS